MPTEIQPMPAKDASEMPDGHMADVLPIRPDTEAEPDAQDAEVIALKPEFEAFTKPSAETAVSQSPQDVAREQMAVDARAKIEALTNEQLVDAHDFYKGVAERSKSGWMYEQKAQEHQAEAARRGVSMDDIRPKPTEVTPPAAEQPVAEAKPKKGIFSFLRRG